MFRCVDGTFLKFELIFSVFFFFFVILHQKTGEGHCALSFVLVVKTDSFLLDREPSL